MQGKLFCSSFEHWLQSYPAPPEQANNPHVRWSETIQSASWNVKTQNFTTPHQRKKKAENQKEPSTMLKCNKTKCNLVRMCILTESRALLKSREALPFSGLSGNTWDWTNSIKSFIQLEYQKFIWKELSSYDASSGFHSFLELSDNSQCKLNVGIYELIWRPLHINRISRKACTCSISFLCKNHLLN